MSFHNLSDSELAISSRGTRRDFLWVMDKHYCYLKKKKKRDGGGGLYFWAVQTFLLTYSKYLLLEDIWHFARIKYCLWNWPLSDNIHKTSFTAMSGYKHLICIITGFALWTVNKHSHEITMLWFPLARSVS